MARKTKRLSVDYTALALRHLREIWAWNVDHNGVAAADKYLAFLRARSDQLQTLYLVGTPLASRLDYRFILIKYSRQGFGHIAVYMVHEDRVSILAFYHERQDWRGKIVRGELWFGLLPELLQSSGLG